MNLFTRPKVLVPNVSMCIESNCVRVRFLRQGGGGGGGEGRFSRQFKVSVRIGV